jgi:catalase
MMTLNRNITDHPNENEQSAFGTGVLVDGIDFSGDKMLVGAPTRTSTSSRPRSPA